MSQSYRPISSDAVLQIIQQILKNTMQSSANISHILPQHKLREDLELDSLAMVNLQVAIEDEFDMRFDPIENNLTEVFETVGSLMAFVESYLAQGRERQ